MALLKYPLTVENTNYLSSLVFTPIKKLNNLAINRKKVFSPEGISGFEVNDGIKMYMPAFETNYAHNYSSGDSGFLDKIVEAGASDFNNLSLETLDSIPNGLGKIWDVMSAEIQKKIIRNIQHDRQGKITNDKWTTRYRGPQLRTQTFVFNLRPSNAAESEEAHKIIKRFKVHSHPVISDTFVFVPDYWVIQEIPNFVQQAQISLQELESDKYFKFGPAVLESVRVNENANGEPTRHADNNPVATDLELKFTEVSMLSKSDIEELGF